MKLFSDFKTSEKLSLSFALFWFFSLLLFLFLINITYFFIWYAEQKEMSFSSMNVSYQNYLESEGSSKDIAWLKNYLLWKDTIIIPEMWELICSPGVANKIKETPEQVKDDLIYQDGETIYFIYSKYFRWVGEVKVFFDTTPYINSQIIIIKTGLIFIFLVFIFQFFLWKYISRRLLKDLQNISESVKNISINGNTKLSISENLPKDDEIRILSDALNNSYDTIEHQTSKLKQFLTDVSHEFKTPLMSMSSRLDVLAKKKEKKSLDPDDITDFFALTEKNILKMNHLLETLFFLSRMEEKKSDLQYESIMLKDFVEQKIIWLWEYFSHKHLEYTLDIPKDYKLLAEKQTFSILLDNLLSNAMKFSPDHMKSRVSAGEWYIEIEDNGPWIDTWLWEKIWEKFYRKDTKKEWFGIWLYLVKRIIDIYDWKIEVKPAEKKWSIFILRLKK